MLGGVAAVVNPDATTERLDLGAGAWVDVTRGWLRDADSLFTALDTAVAWQPSRLFRYDHWVEENRVSSFWRPGMPLPDPALSDIHRTLQRTYKVTFETFSIIKYRDGRDGQAFHRDTDMKWLDDTIIAILTLGATRPWLLRPRANRYVHEPGRGATHDLAPGAGDLIVMGGRSQVDWEHSVAYQPGKTVGVRISLQWRHATRTGRPFQGGSYNAPLTYRSKR